MKPRSAIKTDLFADEHHRKKVDALGAPLADIESHIDFMEQPCRPKTKLYISGDKPMWLPDTDAVISVHEGLV